MNDLMQNYDPLTMPLNKDNDTVPSVVTVRVQLEVMGITDINTIDGVAKLTVTLREFWNDNQLVWDPKLYGGIDTIYLNSNPSVSNKAWTPPILLVEDALGDQMVSGLKYFDVRV